MAHHALSIESSLATPQDAGSSPGTGTGPVIGRALRILGAFSAQRPHLSLSELARRSGLPVSTVHRMLGDLLAWGALERDTQGRYRIGLRLWEVASLAPRSQGLRERALPHLEDLSCLVRENVQLAIRDASEIVFVERIAPSGAVPTLTRVGGRLGITTTAAGLVLLAHAPAAVQDDALAREIPRHTPFTLTDSGRLRAVLAQTRTCGYAVSDRQLSTDTLSVAAPVTTSCGEVTAAVSVVVRHGSKPVGALADLVRSAGRTISRALHVPDS
ncbi:IclR family transcriptional regulator [Streptomyces solaniscabiei]|uniref:IclR family transcriptional regulator n=1 Tax=Streptomyces solaniscabiei TaxID=2683255 RepID=UPI001CE25EB1|nr:IclR family transcriptional regulator [Streptomyces solaniscabiei]